MAVLIYGAGINDADYETHHRVGGKQIVCPFSRRWRNMLMRCYSEKYHVTHPSYADCSVCDDWLTFSNFKLWMERQDWVGKELDKDLLINGNKVYSPEACAFITKQVNNFTLDSSAKIGEFLIGVSWHIRHLKFRSACSNPFTGKSDAMWMFNSEIEAHLAWKNRKHELACQLADLQTNERVANALRTRYL